ncbi:MAG: hypothetical protein IVW57_15280 [Ktedonobacterales bacterium]|nr:hypothetical protein [Ktedonobacterales bacterium]
MVTLMMRSNPFSADFADYLPSAEPMPQERAWPRAAPTSVGIVVTADNHLSPALPGLTPPRRAQRRARLRAAFAEAVTYAIEHTARLFVQAGDLFDSPTPNNQDLAFVAAQLARLRRAGIPCVAISGTHDMPSFPAEDGGEAPLAIYAALDALHYFGETAVLRPRLLELDGLRVAVAGLTNSPEATLGSDPLANCAVEDPDGVLARADAGLLVLHAAIEGLSQPNEGERTITRARLATLPPIFRVVVAGHMHRYSRRKVGEREVLVCGATERMEFGTAAGDAGFAWLEIGRTGVARAEHVTIEEQPRADLLLPTTRLWPASLAANGYQANGYQANGHQADAGGHTRESLADVVRERAGGAPRPDPMAILRMELGEVCTEETMVRLRLAGPLTHEQYHQLVPHEVISYAQRHAFSFELDTSGLVLRDPLPMPVERAREEREPISPAGDVRHIVTERPAGQEAPEEAGADDPREAADPLMTRLCDATDQQDEL